MADFATPTFQLVLEKQRRERETLSPSFDDGRQHTNTHGTLIVGERFRELRERIVDQGELRHV